MAIAHLHRVFALTFLIALTLPAAGPVPRPIEFFEKKIRPLLTGKCSMCHSASLNAPLGGLQVDSRDALPRGGGSGPAIVAGKPGASLLITAAGYHGLDLKMPPTGKLSEREIAGLRA